MCDFLCRTAPSLTYLQPEDLRDAPRTSQSGAFGIFSIELASASSSPYPALAQRQATSEWVALPQWRALSMARHPVALTLRDCSAVQAVLLGSKAKVRGEAGRGFMVPPLEWLSGRQGRAKLPSGASKMFPLRGYGWWSRRGRMAWK